MYPLSAIQCYPNRWMCKRYQMGKLTKICCHIMQPSCWVPMTPSFTLCMGTGQRAYRHFRKFREPGLLPRQLHGHENWSWKVNLPCGPQPLNRSCWCSLWRSQLQSSTPHTSSHARARSRCQTLGCAAVACMHQKRCTHKQTPLLCIAPHSLTHQPLVQFLGRTQKV